MGKSCRGREKPCAGGSPQAHSFLRSVSYPVLSSGAVGGFLAEQVDAASGSCFLCPVFLGCPLAKQQQPLVVLGPSLLEMLTLNGKPLADACGLPSLLIEDY